MRVRTTQELATTGGVDAIVAHPADALGRSRRLRGDLGGRSGSLGGGGRATSRLRVDLGRDVKRLLPLGSGLTLQPGMTFTVEPMINAGGKAIRHENDGWTVRTRDGSLSAHYEHDVALFGGVCRVLTTFEYVDTALLNSQGSVAIPPTT